MSQAACRALASGLFTGRSPSGTGVRSSFAERLARPFATTAWSEYNPCNRIDARLDYQPTQSRMHSPLAHGGIFGLTQMMSHLLGRQAPGWLAAGLLLAIFEWSLTPSAQAGCSHYATTKRDAARSQTVAFEGFSGAVTASGDEWRTSPLDVPPTRPCSGFRCSRDSGSPPGMPRAVPRIDAWGCTLLHTNCLQPTSSPFPHEGDSPRSLDRVERLQRPPR
jgi:hypothetical protein